MIVQCVFISRFGNFSTISFSEFKSRHSTSLKRFRTLLDTSESIWLVTQWEKSSEIFLNEVDWIHNWQIRRVIEWSHRILWAFWNPKVTSGSFSNKKTYKFCNLKFSWFEISSDSLFRLTSSCVGFHQLIHSRGSWEMQTLSIKIYSARSGSLKFRRKTYRLYEFISYIGIRAEFSSGITPSSR